MKQAAPIKLENVTKRFGRDVLAVDNISLDVKAGSLFTLLGPSGCGKTTILRMIAGLERTTQGKVFIDDKEVTKLPANLRDVTMVFQSYALFPHMNVFGNVAYGLQVARFPKDKIRKEVLETLELVGLSGLEDRATNALSGGQQQRVALARALVMHPQVLLFDEPLSNLDAKLRKHVREEIRDLQQRLGITTVYVTHDQEEALAISDIIVVVNEGKIEQIGSPFELYTQPANRFVADFIGSASFIDASYDGKILKIGSYEMSFEQDIEAGRVVAMIRPEAIIIDRNQGLPVTVKTLAYLGSMTDFSFISEVGEIIANITGEGFMDISKGDELNLRFKTAGIHLLKN